MGEANETEQRIYDDGVEGDTEQADTSPFFSNRACEFFPCHEDVDPDEFNCLFCYCPLYALGPRCGGDFEYLPSGVKSCMKCSVPHRGRAGNALVGSRFELLKELARADASC